MDFRKRVVSDFAIIFEGTPEGNDSSIGNNSFAEKWGYFGMMYRLCGGDISKLKTIARTSVLEAFTWLSYETDLESLKRVNINGKQ